MKKHIHLNQWMISQRKFLNSLSLISLADGLFVKVFPNENETPPKDFPTSNPKTHNPYPI